jgi:hypothetical protein
MKVCNVCLIEKNESDFYKDISRKDGLEHRCKLCSSRKTLIWQKNNGCYRNEYLKKYNKNRRKIDINFRLKRSISSRIRDAIKNNKVNSFVFYLGCDIEFYKQYLEEKFQDGMSWDNYGEWEIDHIRPLSLFDLRENFLEAFHYENTQPLWKKENRKKGSKY